MVYAETANIILCQRNLGTISKARFSAARRELQSDILDNSSVTMLSLAGKPILASIDLADKHNLNSTDAALLYLFLDYAQAQMVPCVLLVADARFARAATAEGLTCLNPEIVASADLTQFFSAM